MNDDVMDTMFTLLIDAGKGPVIRDGVDGASRPATETFPYVARPEPESAGRPEHSYRERPGPPELEMDDIQGGALHPRPSPYVGATCSCGSTTRSRTGARPAAASADRGRRPATSDPRWPTAWSTVAFTYRASRPSVSRKTPWRASRRSSGRGWRRARRELGDVGESGPEHWETPLGTPDVHVAVAVLSLDPPSARRRRSPSARDAQERDAGVEVIWRQDATSCRPGARLRLQGRHRPAGHRGQRLPGSNPQEAAHQGRRVHPRLPRRDR